MNSDIKFPAFEPTDPNGNRDLADPSQIKWDPKSFFRWEKDTWDVMRSMTRQPNFWIKHQIESFNNFIDTIPLIIANNSPIVINKNYVDTPTATGLPGYHEYRCIISFKEIFISPPLTQEDKTNGIKRLLPSMARQRDLTYSATLYVDVYQEWFKWNTEINKYESCNLGKKPDVEEKVPLAKIPIMLGSKYCYLHGLSPKMRAELGESEDDEGGYFIINGTEKVVIAFERPRENTILVYPTKGSVTTYTDKVEVKSTIDQRFFPIHETSAFLQSKKDANRVGQTISVKIRYVRNDIPLFVAFRALGIISDKAIMEFILYDIDNPTQADMNMANLLLPSAEEANAVKDLGNPSETISIRTQEEALQYIAHPKNINYKVDFISNEDKKKEARLIFAKNILDKEFLPHMNPPNGEPNNRKKAFYLGHMIRRLLECHLGMQPYNDRDHYDFKRANTTGALLAKIFSPNLKRLNNKIRQNIQKQQTCETNRGLRKDIQSCTIETALKFALSTGNWATSKSGSTSSADKGVAQVLQRMTPYSALSHLRRVMSPLDSTGSKLVPPRKLHPTQFGLICPNETPEGEQVGIVKNLALSVNITNPTSSAPIYACLNDLGIRLLEEVWIGELRTAIKVFVNGHFYGILKQEIAAAVYQELKLLKRDGTLDIHTSISWNIDLKELHVLTDGGRYCRPLYIVEENKETGLFEPLIARMWPKIGENLVKQKTKWHSLVTGTGLTSDKPNPSSYCRSGLSQEIGKPPNYETRMLNGGVIEYLDTTEISMAMIAIDSFSLSREVNGKHNKEWYRFNYLEIHPICMLGVISQMTPFSDHNPSPRNCYQCLDKNELVLMAEGSRKKIADIKVGEQVISIDPDTCELITSTVINQYVKPTTKSIVTVSTISGRKLTCTDDHPILTESGWKQAGSLTKTDLVCVTPLVEPYPLDKADIILDVSMFEAKLTKCGIKDSLIKQHSQELQTLGLLPLFQNQPNAAILARIVGYNITDGSSAVYRNGPQVSMTMGNHDGIKVYVQDVNTLGFASNAITEVESEIHGVVHHGWQVIYNNAYASLIIALGVTLGKKTEAASNIPDWILTGSKLVKREFLAGFQGGDGCKIRFNHLKGRTSPNFVLNTTSLNKCKLHLDSLIASMNKIKEMFAEFGIKCKDIYIQQPDILIDRHAVYLPFECSRANIINYYERIGYRYDLYKVRESLAVYEYLKLQQHTVDNIDMLKKKIVDLKNKGLTYPQIGQQLGITDRLASDTYRARDMKSRVPNNHLSIDSWMKSVKTTKSSLFIPVEKVTSVNNCEIADITIDKKCHSFITGEGIVVHNSSMGKQALGIHTTNYNSRYDTNGYVLLNVQRPLVNPRTMELVGFDKLPTGQQIIVAIMNYTGYNQEDSVMLNGSGLDRGRFNTLASKTHKDKEAKKAANAIRGKANMGGQEQFMKPEKETTKDMRIGSDQLDHLDESGIAKVGSVLKGGDIIIGKTIELSPEEQKKSKGGEIYKDISKDIKKNEYGTVDKVLNGKTHGLTNSDGETLAKVRVTHLRKPIIGDKFASRSAQKGTCGMIYNQLDVPFTASGLQPDLMMNPHAIPSRMTIGQIIESQASKLACMTGEYVDGSSFIIYDREGCEKQLTSYGLNKNCDEIMYDPRTGDQINNAIFITPTYYQRLKHMVDDKMHARDRGPVTLLTRQPQEGRSRDGGLRLGEMERDVFIAHSMAFFLKERLVDFSDIFRVYVSKKHKAIVMANPARDFYMYNNEMLSRDEVAEVQTPYAFKLLLHEIASMGVDIAIYV